MNETDNGIRLTQQLAQQNCGGLQGLGYQSGYYNISKSVEQQIDEASPEQLTAWHERIMKRVSALHKSAAAAHAKLYPGVKAHCCSMNEQGLHCDCAPCGRCVEQGDAYAGAKVKAGSP